MDCVGENIKAQIGLFADDAVLTCFALVTKRFCLLCINKSFTFLLQVIACLLPLKLTSYV